MSKPISLKLLRAALNNPNLPTIFTGNTTHDAARDFVAALVHEGAEDDVIRDLAEAALPVGYTGDSLRELPALIDGARRKGFDKHRGSKSSRRSIAQSAFAAIAKDVRLFHDGEGQSYLAVKTNAGGELCHSVQGRSAELLVREHYFRHNDGKPLSRLTLGEIVVTLDSQAQFNGERSPVFRRIGRKDDVICIDLGDETGEVVRITASGWSIEASSPVAFIRDKGTQPLPRPIKGGTVSDLRKILPLDDDNWTLLVGFLMNCLRGDGPFMCLLVEGQQGSGKSFLCETIKKIIDPNSANRMRLPNDEQELMLQASSYYLPVYDNASGMRGELSDTLCTIATGGALVKRTLFTNDGLSTLSAQRPFIINGIGDFATRPDLLERAIPIQLHAIATRRTEEELSKELAAQLPGVLGALYDAVSLALAENGNVAPSSRLRMIDAARWVEAAEPALGIKTGSFAKILEAKQTDITVERISNEPIVDALMKVVSHAPFFGTMSELYGAAFLSDKFGAGIPQNAAQLSKRLKSLKPSLIKIGIHIRFEERTKNMKPLRVWKDGQDPGKATLWGPDDVARLFQTPNVPETDRFRQLKWDADDADDAGDAVFDAFLLNEEEEKKRK